jgi:CBS domain-containing protein
MEISKIMNKDVMVLNPDDTLKEAVEFFAKNKIGGAPVIDKEKKLLGILSEIDIIKTLKEKTTKLSMIFPSSHSLGLTFQESIEYKEIQEAFKDLGGVKVSEIMTKDIITAKPGQDIEDVAPNLLQDNVKRVPIVEEGKLVGIITRRDIIKGLIESK